MELRLEVREVLRRQQRRNVLLDGLHRLPHLFHVNGRIVVLLALLRVRAVIVVRITTRLNHLLLIMILIAILAISSHLLTPFLLLVSLRQHTLDGSGQVLRRLASRGTQRVLVRSAKKHLTRERGAAEQRKPHLAREAVREVLRGGNGLRENAHRLQHRGDGVAAKVLGVRLLRLETTATLRLKRLLETRELESDALLVVGEEGGRERVRHRRAQRFLRENAQELQRQSPSDAAPSDSFDSGEERA